MRLQPDEKGNFRIVGDNLKVLVEIITEKFTRELEGVYVTAKLDRIELTYTLKLDSDGGWESVPNKKFYRLDEGRR